MGGERVGTSVIIPTRNRDASLRRLLRLLGTQRRVEGGFEVIVCDDGSMDDTRDVCADEWPYRLQYVSVGGCGATEARNRGATEARGAVLIFIDDDIAPSSGVVAELTQAVVKSTRTIALGLLRQPCGCECLWRAQPQAMDSVDRAASYPAAWVDVPFVECLTGLLAVARDDFVALGHFRDPTGGWPNWDDLEFGFRASRAGFRMVRCPIAEAEHWDASLRSMSDFCDRWRRAAMSAALLVHQYPELRDQLPMLRDKEPPDIACDSARLLLRKAARRLSATAPVLGFLEVLGGAGPVCDRVPALRRTARRWVLGAHMWLGYREGVTRLAKHSRPCDPSH